MKPKFKVGDKVRLIVGEDHPIARTLLLNAHGAFPSELVKGKVYTVVSINDVSGNLYLQEASWWVKQGAVGYPYTFVEELD